MKAHQDLTFVRRELDKQFDKSYPNNVNPCKLVSRIRRIQDELPSLKEQCRDLLTAKQIMDEWTDQVKLKTAIVQTN
ncbi:hypothetical protein QJS10_CPA05g02255 [Acorus calamus]|uniref:Protein FAM33A n=1 Tax=Acorus calamus TaxID=4465 RepID=A0AAV9EZ46_ACOCL|nr:hypothetical protein QJS10_CPA05g02255 [Acorus calamus]